MFREQTIGVQQNYNDLSELPDKAKQKLAEGDFIGAQTDFRTYLDNLPDAPDAGEISYWLGESYYVTQSYADAADSYINSCLLYTSPSPRDRTRSRMPSSA